MIAQTARFVRQQRLFNARQEKYYLAIIDKGFHRYTIARKQFATATDAVKYGKRLAARYNRFCASCVQE